MTQYNSLNVKLSNLQLNKLKLAIKNETDVVLRLSSNMVGNSDDETNLPHKLLLTNRQVANLRKAFGNYSSADIKLSKTQLSKMIQSGGFLNFIRPLTKIVLPFLKNSAKPLIKNVLLPLGLTSVGSAADAGIHKKILGSGHRSSDLASRKTTLIISNDEMEDIFKIVRSLEDSGVLLEGVSETIRNEAKEQKGGFLSMLLGTLGASLLGDVLIGKGIAKAGYGFKGKGTIRVGYGSKGSSIKKVF